MGATVPKVHATLKARQRAERHKYQPDMALRVHRALSWLDRAERSVDDPDGRFIFLWIAFNAAYATEIDERFRLSEQATFQAFLGKLLSLDQAKCFDELVKQPRRAYVVEVEAGCARGMNVTARPYTKRRAPILLVSSAMSERWRNQRWMQSWVWWPILQVCPMRAFRRSQHGSVAAWMGELEWLV